MKAPTADQEPEDAVLQLGPRIAAAQAVRFLASILHAAWVKRVRVATVSGELCLVIEIHAPLDAARRGACPTRVNGFKVVLVEVP